MLCAVHPTKTSLITLASHLKLPVVKKLPFWINKKSYTLFFSGNDGVVNLKVLVPSVAAGAIIGKGGETIADIQKQTGGKIKMSKSNDFYPGTQS